MSGKYGFNTRIRGVDVTAYHLRLLYKEMNLSEPSHRGLKRSFRTGTDYSVYREAAFATMIRWRIEKMQ